MDSTLVCVCSLFHGVTWILWPYMGIVTSQKSHGLNARFWLVETKFAALWLVRTYRSHHDYWPGLSVSIPLMCIYLKFTLSKMTEKNQTDYPSLVWKRPKKIVVPVNPFKLFGVANTFAREVCHLCIIRKKHMKIVYISFTFFILPMVQVVRKKKVA